MKIAIFGLGYVGLTSAACLLREGHDILGFDVSQAKVDELRAGRCPIFEPGLQELLTAGVSNKRLSLAVTLQRGDLDDVDVALVCVGTPSAPDGSHNLGFIAEVTRQIASALSQSPDRSITVVYRSTVHPGTMESLVKPIVDSHAVPGSGKIQIVYNPEFLRESTAIADYFAPPRIVIGTEDGTPNEHMNKLYEKIPGERFVTRWRESEVTKLIDNSFHALKIAFANEVGRVCRKLQIDVPTVHRIFVSDTKLNISPYYLRPGSAFGGSCLPKDLRAMTYLSTLHDAQTHVLDSVIRSNDAHKRFILELVTDGLKPCARLLLNGLSFKKNSDDLRESPYVDLAVSLMTEGYQIRIHDPDVKLASLVGQNLGFAYSYLPRLSTLMVTAAELADLEFERVVDARGNASDLPVKSGEIVSILNL